MENIKYARDRKSKALVNTDKESYDAYKLSRLEYYRVQNLSNEVNEIKQDINDIKSLLIELIKEKNNV